jgi:hypothetical protein
VLQEKEEFRVTAWVICCLEKGRENVVENLVEVLYHLAQLINVAERLSKFDVTVLQMGFTVKWQKRIP